VLLLASRLAAWGIERGANESLAETTARAMGISVRELRAEFWRRAGYTKLPIFADIAPQRVGVTTVWFGSFDGLATKQPSGVKAMAFFAGAMGIGRMLSLACPRQAEFPRAGKPS
jgi:hypothetical protein